MSFAARRHARRAPRALLGFIAILYLSACATSRPVPPKPGEGKIELHGLASWYGNEFAGRTTSNGEIFDPKQMTAAHRTLPFGTIVAVTNVKNGKTTRVRVNDRGPFIGNRIIDLSFAAAAELGMVEDGIGEVDLSIVSYGQGDLEPPRPYVVTIPTEPKDAAPDEHPATPVAAERPKPVAQVASVAPPPPDRAQTVKPEPVQTFDESSEKVIAEDISRPAPSPVRKTPPPEPPPAMRGGWAIQAGAFSVESNASELRARLEKFTGPVWIDNSGGLFRVRIGPYSSRQEAIEEKERVEAAGLIAMVVEVASSQ